MGTSNLTFLIKEKRRIESYAQSGQLDKARKIAEKLCRKQRNDAESWYLLGVICGQQGDFARAVDCCRQTVKLAPNVATGYLNLGIALHGAGKLEEAVKPLNKSIELQPDLVVAYRELGIIYNKLTEYQQAIDAFTELSRIQPRDQVIWLTLGNLYEKLQDNINAEKCYRKSYEQNNHSIAAGTNLGNVLKALNRTEEAELLYKQLLQVVGDNPDVLFNLAVLYQSLYRYDEAAEAYQKVINVSPSNLDAKHNLGITLITLYRYNEAIELFSKILEAAPENVSVRRSMATAYKEQGQLGNAEKQLNIILDAVPDDIKARQDRSLVWLQQGEFEKGWLEYEWRTHGLDNKNARWPFPAWTNNGSDDTVLVYPEQGIGDEIMFASCIEQLAQCVNVVLACDRRLEPLFQRSFPDVQVIGRSPDDSNEWLQLLPHIDAQVSIASLPLYFRKKLDQFPENANGYLIVDSILLDKWYARYNALDNEFTVGISWRGGHESNTKFKRSNDLVQWESLLQLQNVNFINLQYGDCVADIEQVKKQFGITLHDWEDSNPLLNIDDFSAKIKALDLVISIDNSTVHLTGALGVKTWVLQPFWPDWRWLPEQKGSYWYGSVKQYRQSVPGKWADVFNIVANDLEEFINNI